MSSSTSNPGTESAPARTSFWSDVAHALKGEQHDYTSERLNRAILLLAVPMVLEMLMESLFAVVDVFWVSRLGRDAVAVIGLTESVMSLIYAVAIGISFAATAIVARRIGEKDPERAARSAAQIVMLGMTIAAGLGVLFGWFAPDILRLMGASPAIVELGSDFARIMLGGNVTVFMIFLINAIFRGAGDAVLAMRTLWLANAFNIALGPCFIFGWGPFPELGVTGAAVATNIGRGIGVLYQLWHLAGHNSRVRVRLKHFLPDPEVLKTIVTTSGNGILQLVISTTSWVGLFKILSMFGSAALAGYTIGIRVILFALLPAFGISNAAATMVGQNLGAGKPERAERAVWTAAVYNMVFLGVVGLAFLVAAPQIARFFTSDTTVQPYAIGCLRTVSLGFVFWLWEIPLAWWLSTHAGLGARGVFIALTIAYSSLAVVSAVLFRRGKWKTKKV